MKKWLSVAAIVILCLALVIGIACGGEDGEAEVKEIKLGVGLPLSGPIGALGGIPAKAALDLMAEKIGVFTVGEDQYRWKIIYEENNYSGAGGAASTNALIYEHGVDLIYQVGPDAGAAANPITEELGIVLDQGSAHWLMGPDKPHSITSFPFYGLAPVLVDWLAKEHPELKHVVGLFGETATEELWKEGWELGCEHYGLEFDTVYQASGSMEWYPIVTKIMTHDPDVVCGGASMFGILPVLWEMGFEGYVVIWGWTEVLVEGNWGMAAGRVIPWIPQSIGDLWPEVVSFRDEFESRYNLELTSLAFWYAPMLQLYTGLFQAAGEVDTDKFLEAVEAGVEVDTIVGPLSYGMEALNGIGHCGLWPIPVYSVVGERQYQVEKVYTADEVQEILYTVFGLK